jgi:hypothetical protein
MHEYLQMPRGTAVIYIAYCAVCLGYVVFVLAACVTSRPYRQRVHRGTWVHVGEGWALGAALVAGAIWARHLTTVADRDWSAGTPPPSLLHIAAVAYWILLPAALAVLAVMAITTALRLLPASNVASIPGK